MKNAKHKTAELTGALLDAAVALAEGVETCREFGQTWFALVPGVARQRYAPSTDWSIGGPLLDRFDVQLGGYGTSRSAEIRDDSKPWVMHWGCTGLEAGMRAIVAYKIGDEVEL